MALAVYSKLLYEANSPPAVDTHIYSVPAGYVTDVRDIVLYNAGYFPWQPIDGVYFYTQTNAVAIYALRAPEACGFKTFHWQGRQILNPGDGIRMVPLALDWQIRITGYELTLP